MRSGAERAGEGHRLVHYELSANGGMLSRLDRVNGSLSSRVPLLIRATLAWLRWLFSIRVST